MKKIAIFGGSFNPVHNEHVALLKAAINELEIDEAYVVPTFLTPNKSDGIIASGEDRLNMCRAAFRDMENVHVSDYEIKCGGVSYTYKTCEYFKEKFGGDKLYFILGEDMLSDFYRWKFPECILSLVTLAVCARENRAKLNDSIARFEEEFQKKVEVFSYVGKRVSSSRIRVLAALGCDISELAPRSVAEYIKERSLYFEPNLASVKDLLTKERFLHTVGVAIFAVENCRRVGVKERDALTAAALHDCAKYIKLTDTRLSGFNIPLDVPPPIMHQYTSAYLAEKLFGISDAEILDAIRYHSNGKPDMSKLCKLLYVADKLEEGRDYDGVGELREAYRLNADEGLLKTLIHNLKYLESESDNDFSDLKATINFLKGQHNDK